MLLTGTPVTVDRDGTTIPVEDIRPGQTLWNPLTERDVEVVRLLRRPFDARDPLPPRLCPHMMSADSLAPGLPDRSLRVLPALRCFGPVPAPGHRIAFEPTPLAELSSGLVRAIGPRGDDAIFLPLPRIPTLVLVCRLLVSLDALWPWDQDEDPPSQPLS